MASPQKVVSLTELRKDLQYLVDEVHFTKQELVIKKGRRNWVRIIPLDESADNKSSQ